MKLWNSISDAEWTKVPGCRSCRMLTEEQGCVDDCMAGISEYSFSTYLAPQTHSFQEGFYVISGEGTALVGNIEFPIKQGMSFLVPRNTPHTVRTTGDTPVSVFWFHCT